VRMTIQGCPHTRSDAESTGCTQGASFEQVQHVALGMHTQLVPSKVVEAQARATPPSSWQSVRHIGSGYLLKLEES